MGERYISARTVAFLATVFWHNERCYTTLEEPITPRPSADIPGVNPMKCLWLRKKPRDDLFDHLRRDDR